MELARIRHHSHTCFTKNLIFENDKVKLYHYKNQVKNPFAIPILIVFSLVNRPDILDLTEDCSFIKNLNDLGMDIYLIDWGYPDHTDHHLSLSKYITDYMNNCINFIKKYSGKSKINLLGICQGGVFSLCYSCIFPQAIKNLIVITTPVVFDTEDNLLSQLIKNININLLVKTMGNIPGSWLNHLFISLQPYKLLGKKYLDFLYQLHNQKYLRHFLSIEKWIHDTPDQAGAAFLEFVTQFFHENNLIQGKITIGNHKIDLTRISIPILNVIAKYDNIIPPSASLLLNKYVSSKDYTVKHIAGGHIGIYVNDKCRKELADSISEWIKARV